MKSPLYGKLSGRALFGKLLDSASDLTKNGRLVDATVAIQRALNSAGLLKTPPAANDSTASPPARVIDGEFVDVTAPRAHVRAAPETAASKGGAQFLAGVHRAAAGTRDYKLFVPATQRGGQLPMVVMLHGCKQNPDDFAAGTRMNQLAQKHGVMVLYPAQGPRSNSSKCWNWFQPGDQRRGQGEPALLAAMTQHISAEYGADPQQVFVAGLSAGGAMAAILGREYHDVFAAVGVHSGLPAGAAHDVTSAFAAMQSGAQRPASASHGAPIIVFHGDRDSTVNAVNGEQLIAAQAGITAPSAHAGEAGRRFTRSVYQRDGRVQAEHWLIHGAGHAWSGGSSEGSYTDPLGPDASAEFLRFFLAQSARARAL